jgi:uncharacterized repeat protein (TIGR03803 family)
MFEIFDSYGKCILGCGLAMALLAPLDSAAAKGKEKVLYSFCSQTHCFDGQAPRAGLITDKKGNFYGTTYYGGSYNYGAIFKLAPKGTETALYSFEDGSDGYFPVAGLIMDSAGNLYGTTEDGGTGCVTTNGCGTVFKLAPNGTETVLYAFTNGSDGGYPEAGLIMDKEGNLYGTTDDGGANAYGTVFKVAPDGTETVLHSFTGSDGANPVAGLIMDKKGNFYGTTAVGGTYGYGTVFKLAPNGTETVLYAFTNGSDGGYPENGVIMDKERWQIPRSRTDHGQEGQSI